MKNVLKEDTENLLGCVTKGIFITANETQEEQNGNIFKNYTYFYVFLGEKPYFPRRAKKKLLSQHKVLQRTSTIEIAVVWIRKKKNGIIFIYLNIYSHIFFRINNFQSSHSHLSRLLSVCLCVCVCVCVQPKWDQSDIESVFPSVNHTLNIPI